MQVHHYTTVEPQPMPGREGVQLRWVLGANVGAPNFAMRVIEISAGTATEQHAHDWEHEVYVIEGQGSAWHADGETSLAPGDCVYVAPNEPHQFRNTGENPLRIVCVVPNPR
ncbi:MAG: cupin domain-containing protein [Anaerolineae bacterium]